MHPSLNEVIFTWGKFKGHTLGSVRVTNPQYLQWIVNTPGLPDAWKVASQRALSDEDVSDLSLPRTKLAERLTSDTPAQTGPIEVGLENTKTAFVVMPYNKLLLEQFKYEIDGRTWNSKEKRWDFPAVHLPKAKTIFPTATFSSAAEQMLEKLWERREDLDEIRQLEDVEFEIPGLQLQLYPYQRTGVKFVDRADGRCLIADAPGLGKTAQAIAYAQLHNLKTLIVCPLSVVINWQREIKKFTGKQSTIWDSKTYDGDIGGEVVGKITNWKKVKTLFTTHNEIIKFIYKNQSYEKTMEEFSIWLDENNLEVDETGQIICKEVKFHLIHYDAVAKAAQRLREQNFDLLVCDEATYLKNRQTIRAKSLLGSWKERIKYPGIKTKYCIFLTGTPVMSRPIEAFSLLNFLDKNRFSNFFHFVQRYGGWRGQAPMNLQDLHDRTKDLVIRRKKDQVLTELPAKQRNDLYVELTKDERAQYNKLLKEMFGHWKMEGKPSVKHMPKIQGFLIDKKLPRVIEMIDEFLDNDRSILIFSNYIAPLKMLEQHYGNKSAMLTGQMKKTDRQESIDKLSDGRAKVGLFSLMAAGMGIDGLQHQISTVVFLNMDFVPANHEQAEDRTHRIGQKGQVQVYYMVCEDSIDEYMRELLQEKQKIADMIVDGALVTPANSKSFFKEFVKKISFQSKQSFDESLIDENEVISLE